ncbi:MAG: pyrimidine 5'-nucleotidase [Alphaproteobacteria bacterium HGW-Alphaproteobacteria-16]|nr:MAG: pyrimidine 5'-nucleotidase [Alphaproteobacteria bacterium HGW-Alphaproteobacteria-16]
MRPDLAHIDAWLFDLDNTLYPGSAGLFAQMDARIGAYVARVLNLEPEEAWRVQKGYFISHGTTLAGLMAEHGVDPYHYLADVHDIEIDVLEHNAPLAAAIGKLPGRKIVFTNADAPYAEKVLRRLGILDHFEAIHDVHASAYHPKPHPHAYASLCDTYRIDPTSALFVEDMARNLAPAKALGMTTVWIDNGSEQAPDADRSYIDHITHDIRHWLTTALEHP